MSACMDFIGNQYLLEEYRKAANVDAKGKILGDLVEALEIDGFSHEEAVHEVEDAVGKDDIAKAALMLAEKRHFKVA